jgi:hypothetical protein
MTEAERPVPPPASEEVVAEAELLRLAGIDMAHFLTLSDFEQRLVLKMAEQLVNAERRAEETKSDDQLPGTG